MKRSICMLTAGVLAIFTRHANASYTCEPLLYAFDSQAVWVQGARTYPRPLPLTAFYGDISTTASTVSNSLCSDLVAWNHWGVWVLPATGCKLASGVAFGTEGQWSGPFSGTIASLIGDVDGDGLQDLVAWNSNDVQVEKSTGSGFSPPGPHYPTGGIQGNFANLLGDVDGDGKADLIAWSTDEVVVELSNGAGFGPPQRRAGRLISDYEYFTQNPKAAIADIDLDGKMDLILWEYGSIQAVRSNGSGFDPLFSPSVVPFLGDTANLTVNVSSGPLYLLAVNSKSSWFEQSSGMFTSPKQFGFSVPTSIGGGVQIGQAYTYDVFPGSHGTAAGSWCTQVVQSP